MQHDVADLRAFYHSRPLGRVVQRLLRERVAALWPPEGATGMTVAGYGYALPLLRPQAARARRVLALMPASQGAVPWDAGGGNAAVVVEETAWPLETGAVDRLLLLHALETSEQPARLLAEASRVLGPGGRLLAIVPNRTGLWARSEATPFGTGRSYTPGQLEAQARAAGFVAERAFAALYIPPSERRFWLGAAAGWERTGARLARLLVAGVIVAEFTKQVHALRGPGVPVQVPSPLAVLAGVRRPRPAEKPVAGGL